MGGRKKYTIEYMQALADTKGGQCLSAKYIDINTPSQWQCAKGHQWQAAMRSIVTTGKWCPVCAAEAIVKNMQKLAEKRGGRCLSAVYINNITPLRWECANGHQWKATPASIKRGSWCPACHRRSWTIDDMHQLAAEKNGRCLSSTYINHHTKLIWECQYGHRWNTSPESIIYGRWCPDCSGTKKKTIEDMQQLASKNKGQCLSAAYTNTRTPLRWRCAEGHEWETAPFNIQQGHWCPHCAGTYRPYRRKQATQWHIEDMQALAEEKGGKCLSEVYKSIPFKLTWECQKKHIWEATSSAVIEGCWCPFCARNRRHTLTYMQELAKMRGGRCLSEKYINSREKLLWECQKKHRWEIHSSAIISGSWCPVCKTKKVYADHAIQPPWSVEKMDALAQQKGGHCLSTHYINANTKLRWCCQHGHEWEADPASIIKGHWCRLCANNKRKRSNSKLK